MTSILISRSCARAGAVRAAQRGRAPIQLNEVWRAHSAEPPSPVPTRVEFERPVLVKNRDGRGPTRHIERWKRGGDTKDFVVVAIIDLQLRRVYSRGRRAVPFEVV